MPTSTKDNKIPTAVASFPISSGIQLSQSASPVPVVAALTVALTLVFASLFIVTPSGLKIMTQDGRHDHCETQGAVHAVDQIPHKLEGTLPPGFFNIISELVGDPQQEAHHEHGRHAVDA